MDLYVVRHAKAVEGGAALADQHRALTDKGRKRARQLGKQLRRERVVLDAIVTSPLVRAVETAELLAVGMKFPGGLEVAAELAPHHPPQAVIDAVLAPRAALGSVAIVGHEPQLSDLINTLLRCSNTPEPRKPSALRLEWTREGEPARFVWVLHADLDEPSPSLEDAG